MAKSTPTANTTRVPQQSVVVHRDGKQIVPPIGQPFEFTAAELAEIESINPDAITALAVVDLTTQPVDSGL